MAGVNLAAMFSVAGCALSTGILLYYGWRRDKIIFFAGTIFAVWLIPAASGMFINPDYYAQGRAVIAESWFYLPCIGIATLTARLFTGYGRHPGWGLQRVILVLFALYLSIITITENRHWKNNRILFSHTLRYARTSPVLYRNLAWVYLNKGDTVSAIQMYSRALGLRQTDKSRVILYKDLGLAYMSNKDGQKAFQVAREAIKIDPDYAGSYGLLGLLYSYDESERAQEECRKALEIDPFEPTAFNYLLQASTSNKEISAYLIGKYKEALKGLHGFDAYKTYRSLGIAYIYAGVESEAITNLKKAEQINPYDPKTNTALAICYVKKGDAVLAERLFRRSLRLNPFDKEAYSNLALFYSGLGRNKEALFMKQKASSVNLFD
jgi:Flp pilus assembly protein TadD